MYNRFLLISFFFCLSQLIRCQTPDNLDTTRKPHRILFIPNSFSNSFSLNINPVLHIISGDTIQTETIDALGRDKNGIRRQRGGNPLTGPFYISSAKPGDVLKVTLIRVSLNRNYAYTSESFVSRSVPDSVSKAFKKPHLVKWKLDPESGFGSPDSSFTPYNNLAEFKVSLRPFLGCIGVAPANSKNEILSFFQGDFGGNLDFSGICQSAIIYLPVFHEGAYFYIGDGHAVQGDGEIAGNALETSLDVEFSAELIKKETTAVNFPRVEDSVHLMALGSDKSIDQAIKMATGYLLEWLQQDYHLTWQEATQVMSTSIEYTIAEIADPEVIVVAKIKKEVLKKLRKIQ
jgi:acetamidase/formamidase